jgi:hypothetical protein
MKTSPISLLIVLLATVATAADRKAPAKGAEPTGQMTCGQYLAAKAALPGKIADTLAVSTDLLELHAKWVSSAKDKASKAEEEFLTRLVKEQRTVIAAVRAIGDEQAKGRDLPMPRHPQKPDPKLVELMTAQAKTNRELALMLQKEAEDLDKRIAASR